MNRVADPKVRPPRRLAAADDQIAEAYRALGSPARVKILRVLCERERYCGDLVKLFDLSQSTISHHLKTLRETGLVEAEEHGVSTCYRVNFSRLQELRDHLSELADARRLFPHDEDGDGSDF